MNGPDEAGGEQAEPRAPGLPVAHLRAARARRAATGAGRASANGFVATTSSATTPSASSAAVWPGELLLRGRRPRAARAARARRASRAAASTARRTRPSTGQCAAARDSRVERARRRRPARRRRSAKEHEDRGRPRARSRAGCRSCAERGRERDPPPAAAREEVDRGDDERQQHRDQHELDRPAADEPLAEVDVARRALRRARALVERADELLGGAADVGQPLRGRAAPGVSPNAAGGRSPAVVSVIAGMPRATSGRLLVEGEREAEVDELPERARPRRARSRSARRSARRRSRRASPRASAGWSPAITSRGGPSAGDRVEVDDRDDPARLRVVLGEARGAEAAEGAAVGGEEDERVRRADACAGRPPAAPYARASSISAAVPEALSFAPAPVPASSRCAITTIASGERPGPDRDTSVPEQRVGRCPGSSR